MPAVIAGVSISNDGKTIAAATDDHRVTIWDAATGNLKDSFASHSDWVHAAAMSQDGSTMASGASDRSLCLWGAEGSSSPVPVPGCDYAISAVSFHPNDQQIAVVGFSNSLKIINTSTGQVSQELVCPCRDVRTVAFSRNGELMAVAGRNGKIRVWHVTNGARAHDIETDGRRIRTLAYSPDGRWLAAAGNSPEIRILDAATGELAMTLNTRPAKVYSLVFISDGRIASGGSDNRILIWDLNIKEAVSQLVGHTGTVAALACNGDVLVSGSYDTTLRVWNLGDERRPETASLLPGEQAR